MPEADGAVVISNISAGLSALEPFSRHFFVGSNRTVLSLLRDNIDGLGITASSSQFQATIARLMGLLQDETASIEICESGLDGDTLTLGLDIEQLVGNKFPTGFPSRRAWIHLTVTDANGNIVFESGKLNEDGTISGNDADADAATFEPHYDVITSGDLSDSGDVNRMVDAIDQVYAIDKQVRAMIPPNGLAGVHDRLMAGIEHYALGCDLLVQGMLHLDEDFLSPAYDEWNLGREMIEELIAFVGDAPWGVPRQVSWTLSP